MQEHVRLLGLIGQRLATARVPLFVYCRWGVIPTVNTLIANLCFLSSNILLCLILQKFEDAANAFYDGVTLNPENMELVTAFRSNVICLNLFMNIMLHFLDLRVDGLENGWLTVCVLVLQGSCGCWKKISCNTTAAAARILMKNIYWSVLYYYLLAFSHSILFLWWILDWYFVLIEFWSWIFIWSVPSLIHRVKIKRVSSLRFEKDTTLSCYRVIHLS